MEHIDDLDAALRQVRRVLVPGGWCCAVRRRSR
ncbi:methyltransferase domain-containing protein [Micromonospora aurantiaca (nom. illeg.)]